MLRVYIVISMVTETNL